MSFQSATQETHLDRTGTVAAATAQARLYRERFPLLATADDMALVKAAKNGDQGATLELVARHESRIQALVNKASVGAAPVTDRTQAALLGFLEAVKGYDDSHGAAFFTYAHNKITTELQECNRSYDPKPGERNAYRMYWEAMAKNDNIAPAARHWSGLQRLSAVALEELAESGDMLAREIVDARLDRWERAVRKGDAPEWDEYAKRTGRGLDGPTFDAIHASVSYLDAATETDDGEAGTGHDLIADDSSEQGFRDVEGTETVRALLAELDERGAEIVARAFGIDRPQETQREIADALGLSRPRVANIIASCVKIMRATA